MDAPRLPNEEDVLTNVLEYYELDREDQNDLLSDVANSCSMDLVIYLAEKTTEEDRAKFAKALPACMKGCIIQNMTQVAAACSKLAPMSKSWKDLAEKIQDDQLNLLLDISVSATSSAIVNVTLFSQLPRSEFDMILLAAQTSLLPPPAQRISISLKISFATRSRTITLPGLPPSEFLRLQNLHATLSFLNPPGRVLLFSTKCETVASVILPDPSAVASVETKPIKYSAAYVTIPTFCDPGTECHAYILYAHLLFGGRGVNSSDHATLLSKINEVFTAAKLPLPSFAQAASFSVVRVYWKSPTDRQKAVEHKDPNDKERRAILYHPTRSKIAVQLLSQKVLYQKDFPSQYSRPGPNTAVTITASARTKSRPVRLQELITSPKRLALMTKTRLQRRTISEPESNCPPPQRKPNILSPGNPLPRFLFAKENEVVYSVFQQKFNAVLLLFIVFHSKRWKGKQSQSPLGSVIDHIQLGRHSNSICSKIQTIVSIIVLSQSLPFILCTNPTPECLSPSKRWRDVWQQSRLASKITLGMVLSRACSALMYLPCRILVNCASSTLTSNSTLTLTTTLLLILTNVPSVEAVGNSTSTEPVSTLCWTILALNVSSGLRKKVERLRSYVVDCRGSPDIIVVSETGLTKGCIASKPTVYGNDKLIKGYKVVHIAPKQRKRTAAPDNGNNEIRERQGISVLVHQKWDAYIDDKEIELMEELNAILVPMKIKDKVYQFVGVYAEPTADKRDEYWIKFEKWYTKLERASPYTILIGDFNTTPCPSLDRTSAVGERDNHKGFLDMLGPDDTRLKDAWRVMHGEKRNFTWRRNDKDEDSPMSRIDLALISPAFERMLDSCEILPTTKPLTIDHSPIEIKIQRPNCTSHIPEHLVVPERSIQRFNVKLLDDEAEKQKFKQAIEEALSRRLAVDNHQTEAKYTSLRDSILDAAAMSINKYEIILYKKPRKVKRTRLERASSYSHAVLLSKPHILAELSSKTAFPMTKNVCKLLRHLPDDVQLDDPSHLTNVDEGLAWLSEVSKVNHLLHTLAMSQFKDKTLEVILERVEKASLSEISQPRKWFQKAAGVLGKKARNQRIQLNVQDELSKPADGADPHTSSHPEETVSMIREFWAHLFKFRENKTNSKEAVWLHTEKFKARRMNLRGGEMLTAPISMKELCETFARLKKGKAIGEDGIHAEFLINLPEPARKEMLEVFNEILRTKYVPEDWKLAKIFTIFKSGDAALCSNYRPISITSVVYKTFMVIMTKRLEVFIESNHLLSEAQGGFRKNRSTIDKIMQLVHIYAKRKRTKGDIHTVFLDVKKAYDSVPHEQLFETLEAHGLPEDFIVLMKCLYRDGKATVITAFGDTPTFQIERGVKQGCPMSPLIFNLFLEPLLEWIEDQKSDNSFILAFADDVAINTVTQVELQTIMRLVERFFHYNCLDLGIAKNKTAYMTTDQSSEIKYRTLKESIQNGRISLAPAENDSVIPKLTGKESYRYLGVYINCALDWTEHFDRAESRLKQHLHFLYKSYYTRRQLVKIANVIIIPYVTYGLEVTTPSWSRAGKWDRMINNIINVKGGVMKYAATDLNHLGYENLGENLESIVDKLERLQYNGRLKYALNSIDKNTASLAKAEWQTDESLYSGREFSRKLMDRKLPKIVPNGYSPYIVSLDTIFPPRDPDSEKLFRVYQVYVCRKIFDNEKRLVPNIATQENDIKERICLSHSSIIKPILAYRVLSHAGTSGIQTQLPVGEPLDFFTDGSLQGEKVGFAIYSPQIKEYTHQEAMPAGSTIYSAELHAAVTALLLHDETRPLRIFSDNKSVCQTLSQPLRHVADHPDEAEWLHAAHDTIQRRTAKGLSTSIHHVYSHLLDDQRPSNYDQKMKHMKDTFKEETQYILEGNKAVDNLAKHAVGRKLPNLAISTKYLGDFIIKTNLGDIVTNISDHLKHTRTQERIINLKSEKSKRYDWLNKKGIDWHRSAYLGKDKDRKANPAQRHASKARRNMFADKVSRSQRQHLPFWLEKRYGQIKVNDQFCDLCRNIESQPVPETREHYLCCKALSEERRKITSKVLNTLQEASSTNINDVPCYWNEEQKHPQTRDKAIKEIETFSPIDASKGLIPRSWVSFVKSLEIKEGQDKEQLIAKCQRIITEGIHACWKIRCKKFYELHKPQQQNPG